MAGPFDVVLTVTNEYGRVDVDRRVVVVSGSSSASGTSNALTSQTAEQNLTLLSSLEFPRPSGAVQAKLIFNGRRTGTTTNGTPYRHQMAARAGRNTIEGHLMSVAGEGRWRFEFDDELRPAAGTLQVEQGQILSLSPSSVVFRLRGSAGERIKFSFETRTRD